MNLWVHAICRNQSMWQDEIAATNPSSGSTPRALGAVAGIFAGDAQAWTSPPDSNRHTWERLYVGYLKSDVALRHSMVAECSDMVPLHSENAEPGFLDRRVERSRDRRRQRAPCFLGRDDAVVPETGGRIIGVSLLLILLEDGPLELLLLLLAPLAAFRLDAVAFHRGEHGGSLLAAHHRDARVRPHPQEARRERSAAHAVVARSEGPADDDGEFRDAAAGDCGHQLRAVFGDTARLVFLSDHEAVDVLEEHERNPALAAQLDEVRPLQCGFREQDAVVRDDSDRVAADAREPGHQCRPGLGLELVELACVDDARDDLAHVVGLALVLGDDAEQFLRCVEWLGRLADVEIRAG